MVLVNYARSYSREMLDLPGGRVQLAVEFDMSRQGAVKVGSIHFQVSRDLIRQAVGNGIRYLKRGDLARREFLLAQHGRFQRGASVRKLEFRPVELDFERRQVDDVQPNLE